MRASWLGYALGMALMAAAAFGILERGAELPVKPLPEARAAGLPVAGTSSDPLATFLLQLVVVAVMSRLAGETARRLGQPLVVGEIAAGVALGPSVLGAVSPSLYAGLFPARSLGALSLVSQLGVVAFMFLVGLELDVEALNRRSRAALVV
ncbi:MAG: cation:proton antiporter, partial [Elusimicrobia bacterium]|nr:cation:proton antiporter [Elusimicrobiota bacterium]